MKLQKKKFPDMVPQSPLSRRLRDQEDDLMAMKPASPKEQPPKVDDEKEASKQGPSVPALSMKKMAMGGDVDMPQGGIDEIKPDKGYGKIIIMKADGGEVEEDEHTSLAAAIMARRDRKMMAEGGQVSDIDSNEEETPSQMDSENDSILKENYDTDIVQPMDSNEESAKEDDTNAFDKVSAIRNRMISKRIGSK